MSLFPENNREQHQDPPDLSLRTTIAGGFYTQRSLENLLASVHRMAIEQMLETNIPEYLSYPVDATHEEEILRSAIRQLHTSIQGFYDPRKHVEFLNELSREEVSRGRLQEIAASTCQVYKLEDQNSNKPDTYLFTTYYDGRPVLQAMVALPDVTMIKTFHFFYSDQGVIEYELGDGQLELFYPDRSSIPLSLDARRDLPSIRAYTDFFGQQIPATSVTRGGTLPDGRKYLRGIKPLHLLNEQDISLSDHTHVLLKLGKTPDSSEAMMQTMSEKNDEKRMTRKIVTTNYFGPVADILSDCERLDARTYISTVKKFPVEQYTYAHKDIQFSMDLLPSGLIAAYINGKLQLIDRIDTGNNTMHLYCEECIIRLFTQGEFIVYATIADPEQ